MAKLLKKEEMQKIEEKIKSFFDRFGIVLRPPVDVFQVAGLVGFDVRAADFGEPVDGLIAVNETLNVIENFTTNKIIAYNVFNNIQEKKFVVAHELGHYIDEKMNNPEKQIIIAFRDRNNNNYSEDENEQNIDYFAAAILMPLDFVKKDLENNLTENVSLLASDLSVKYNVAVEVVKRRIEEVKTLTS